MTGTKPIGVLRRIRHIIWSPIDIDFVALRERYSQKKGAFDLFEVSYINIFNHAIY